MDHPSTSVITFVVIATTAAGVAVGVGELCLSSGKFFGSISLDRCRSCFGCKRCCLISFRSFNFMGSHQVYYYSWGNFDFTRKIIKPCLISLHYQLLNFKQFFIVTAIVLAWRLTLINFGSLANKFHHQQAYHSRRKLGKGITMD